MGRRHPPGTGKRHIGYILSEAATNILEIGIDAHFPNINPSVDSGGRFGVYQSSRSPDIYEVTDAELQLVFDLPKENLEDPSFNLIGWYLAQLEENDLYNSRYLASMVELGCVEEDPKWVTIPSEFEPEPNRSLTGNLSRDWADIDPSEMNPWGCMGDTLLIQLNNVL